MKINEKALAIIDHADSQGYVNITGKTKLETRQNLLNFFEESLALENEKNSTKLEYEDKQKLIYPTIKKVAYI